MTFLFANNASGALASSISSGATALTLVSGQGSLFPSPTGGDKFALTLTDAATGTVSEIMYCTSRAGDVCTVVRAQEGTTALNWAAGDFANNYITAGTAAAFSQNALTNPMTAKGDTIVGGVGGTPARIAVGADGYVYTADSTQPDGVKWAPPSGVSGSYPNEVWVSSSGSDFTGTVGDPALPFATIQAAIVASSGATAIHIGVGRFAAPIGDTDYSNPSTPNPASVMRAGLAFIGEAVPRLDDYTTPTTLIGGTIIVGPITINGINTRDGIQVRNLGIDCGSAALGADRDGLAVFNIGQVNGQAPLQGLIVDHVITLGRSATAATHGFAFENCVNPQVSNLQTYWNTHGVAWKCVGGYCRGVASYGHHSDGFIVKESNFGNASAPCNNTSISDVTVGTLSAGDTNVGLWFETSGTNDLHDVTVSNFHVVSAMAVADVEFITDSGATGGMERIIVNGFQSTNHPPTMNVTQSGGALDQNSISLNGSALNGEVTLTSASTVNTDASRGANFRVVLGTNATLANPSNMIGGQVYQWRIKQDGTGGRTLAYGSAFKWAGGTAPVLSTAANAEDLISAQYSATDGTLIGAALLNVS